MATRANPGPEYLRADEWKVVRRRRSFRRGALAAALGLVAVAGAIWWTRAPGLRASAELHRAAEIVRSERNSQISAFTLGANGVREAVWHEWRVADRSRLQIERTGAVFVHGDGRDLAYDPHTETARDHVFGKSDLDGRAVIAELFERAARSPRLQRLPEDLVQGRPMHPYRFEQGRERFVLWVDKQSGRPTGCFVEIHTPDGWVPTHEFVVDLASPVPAGLLGFIPPDSAIRYDLTDPRNPDFDLQRVVAEVPLGDRAAIRFGAVEMNREGALYLVVHGVGAAAPYVTDDLGTFFFRRELVRTWAELGLTEYVFVPMEREPREFRARTVVVHFPASNSQSSTWPPRDLATYEVTFRKPTCVAAPMYRQTHQGADYAALYEVEAVRGQHLARIMRLPNGRPVDQLADSATAPNDQMSRANVNPDDLFAAARAYRRALALYRESGVFTGPTPATVWFRLFELVQSHGEVEDARRVLQSAEAAITEGRNEPMASEIRLTARSWRKNRPADPEG